MPWKSIFTSRPYAAAFAGHLSNNWATITLTSLGPMYLARVQGFDIKSVSTATFVPTSYIEVQKIKVPKFTTILKFGF